MPGTPATPTRRRREGGGTTIVESDMDCDCELVGATPIEPVRGRLFDPANWRPWQSRMI
jgi:hypothetical protein